MEEADQHQHHDHDPKEEQQQQQQQEEEQVILGCKEQHTTTTTTTTNTNITNNTNINNNIIIKGKRTKRRRPQSPIPFAIPTHSSTADGGECYNNTSSSPTTTATSSDHEPNDSTEEEEDMANCLILLAQGQSKGSPDYYASSPKLHQQLHIDHHNVNTSSRRLISEATPLAAAFPAKMAAAGGGYYVYECKTCSRTFPSFQALGGHRASHKKPKAAAINIVEDKNINNNNKHFGIGMLPSDEEDSSFFKNMNMSCSSPLSLHLSNKALVLSANNNNKSKVHECSICGAEFTSGQALGGHMRRHRAPVGGSPAAANTTLSLTVATPPPSSSVIVPLALEAQQPQNQQQQQPPIKKQRSMLSLDLDLNLPAPEDDHYRDQSKFVYASTQQQQQPQKQQQQESGRNVMDGERVLAKASLSPPASPFSQPIFSRGVSFIVSSTRNLACCHRCE